MTGPGDLVSCSSCGKSRNQVKVMIGGAHAHICDQCVSRAHALMADHAAGPDQAGAERCGFCDKRRDHVGAMASAGEMRICDECLELCDEIVSDVPPVPSR